MGASCSCPFAFYLDLENGLEAVLKSMDEPTTKSLEAFVRLGTKDEARPMMEFDAFMGPSNMGPKSPKNEAAVKLQKVYKSFRTRRKLADCAVLIEQSWWKLLDFAELKHSSISFFHVQKHETAVSRWSRARTRAAKMERKPYEVAVEDGKLIYRESGEFLNTIDEPKGTKWIFVLSTSRTLYVGKKIKGLFQHSSFLAGGATLAAGRIVAENGILKAVWPHSGHYRPTRENFQDFLSFMRDNNVDLTHVKLDSIDEEDSSTTKHIRSNSSYDDLFGKERPLVEENVRFNPKEENESVKLGLNKLKSLVIPRKGDKNILFLESPFDENLTAKDVPLVDDEEEHETIPEEHILERIKCHKKMGSFQLGKQLSCKWSTGAGPRIGCLRDYPSGLQCHALEKVNLSPRSKRNLRFEFPARSSTPTSSSNLSRSLGQFLLLSGSAPCEMGK
ncbi:calmodulin binding protein, partial [Striga asiatica]